MKRLPQLFFATLLLLAAAMPAGAQAPAAENTDSLIRRLDGIFWKAYNNCDVAGMTQYFTDDVEFYHDKGGVTLGRASFDAAIKKSLCGNEAFRLRREVFPASVQVFPLHQNGTAYGAIISGAHYFYINEKGKPEYRDGLARFTHLWLLKNDSWKMARILSFDHGPADRELSKPQ